MNIFEAWVERIRHDLAPFVDPSTTLDIAAAGSVIDVIWIQRRKQQEARFVVRDAEGVYVVFKDRELSYRAFFASEEMADIAGIAQTSCDILKAALYIETKAESEDVPDARDCPALDLISSLSSSREDEDSLTNFVMVTGEAGAGKTSVLKELVRRQSQLYLKGASDFVYLYVNAQGRALARFNEAVSTELNELRVTLPHHAVAPMVKMGLIVPVIDGFDELIGVGGYDDAFNSISSFVQALDGRGALVASARSTYYEQEFLSRSARASALKTDAWKLLSVSVKGWGLDERTRYVEAKLATDQPERVQSILHHLNRIFSGENEPLASKPLFVARATDLVLKGLLIEGEGGLLERLVGAFIQREQSEKLLRKDGGSILSEGQISSLCSDIGEEMWNLGTRELDRSTVRELADIAMSDMQFSASDRATVVERVPNMAFLQPGESFDSVSFEHELFFDFFLANRIAASLLADAPSLGLLLSRSAMPESLADSIAGCLFSSESFDLDAVTSRLGAVSRRATPRQQLVRENSGMLVGQLLARCERADGLSFDGLVFPGSQFHGLKLTGCRFEGCELRRCDLTGANFADCVASATTFESPMIDESTKLGVAGLDVSSFSGLRVADATGVRTVYDPDAMVALLAKAGLPVLATANRAQARNVDPAVIRLIERLARAYAKCNPICVQDDYLRTIFEDEKWQQIQRLAIESGVLKAETRDAKGSRRDFIRRLVRPEDILAGLWIGADIPVEIDAFWKAVELEFPAARN